MTPTDLNGQTILRLEEQLRQERKVFDQTLTHSERWFTLRLRLGYLAAVLLPSFFLLSSYIVINYDKYPGGVITAASGALFADVLGLILSVWKLVLNPDSLPKAKPLINAAEAIEKSARTET